jgi:hypothetical protein
MCNFCTLISMNSFQLNFKQLAIYLLLIMCLKTGSINREIEWKLISTELKIIYICTFGRRAVAGLPAYRQNGHIWRPDGHCCGMGPNRGKILFCSKVSYYMPSDRTEKAAYEGQTATVVDWGRTEGKSSSAPRWVITHAFWLNRTATYDGQTATSGGLGPDRGKILFCSKMSYYMPPASILTDRTNRPLMTARRPLWWDGAEQRENPLLLQGDLLHVFWPNRKGRLWRPDGHCGGLGPDREKILPCSKVNDYIPTCLLVPTEPNGHIWRPYGQTGGLKFNRGKILIFTKGISYKTWLSSRSGGKKCARQRQCEFAQDLRRFISNVFSYLILSESLAAKHNLK